jgi:hypothetical protein
MNGAQVGTALSNHQLYQINTINNWFGKSNYALDSQFAGRLEEFHIYDEALPASHFAGCSLLGPDGCCPGPGCEPEILTLEVNTATGQVKMKNAQEIEVPIDYYKISSAAGALDVSGWNSFDEQEGGGPPGEGWDESGGSDEAQLIEYYLGSSGDMFPALGERTLGAAYDASTFGDPDYDLTFEYGGPSGYLIQGSVVYITNPFGDYNDDGEVNAADYTVYRNCLGGIGGGVGPCMANDPTPESVDYSDYLYWKAHYGETAGSGSSVTAGNIPEPASLALLACGLILAAGSTRRSLRPAGRVNGVGFV